VAIKSWNEVFGQATPTPSKTKVSKGGIKSWDEVFGKPEEKEPPSIGMGDLRKFESDEAVEKQKQADLMRRQLALASTLNPMPYVDRAYVKAKRQEMAARPQVLTAKPPEMKNPFLRAFDIGADALVRDATLGLSDKIERGLDKLLPGTKVPQTTPRTGFEKGVATAGELGGALLPIGATFKLAELGTRTAGRALPKVASRIPEKVARLGNVGIAGGAYEGSRAAIEGEPLPEVAKSAAEGAVLWPAMDVGLGLAGKGIKAAGKKLLPNVKPFDVTPRTELPKMEPVEWKPPKPPKPEPRVKAERLQQPSEIIFTKEITYNKKKEFYARLPGDDLGRKELKIRQLTTGDKNSWSIWREEWVGGHGDKKKTFLAGDLTKKQAKDLAKKELLSALPKAESPKTKLPELQKQTMRRIDEAIEPATLPVGMTVKQVKRTPGEPPAEGFKFTDPEIEARWTGAQGLKGESLPSRIKQGAVEFWHRATREYEHLPKNKEFAQLRFDLKKLEKQKEVSKDSTARLLQGITLNLDKEGYNVFSRKVILDDLAEEAAKGRELPFGFTAESLAREKALVDQAAEGNQAVKDALAQRKQVQDTIKSDYIKAMKDIGFDVSERLTNENYFHHQVLEYANAKNIAGTGSRLKTPTGRGFLKKREGSTFDINTDYLQAEAEVTAQMLYDIEVARTIKNIDNQYNIARKLKAQAKKEGVEDWRELIPEGYTLWQPREGNMFYMADSVPAKIAEKLYSDSLLELGIKAEDLNRVLAMGQKFREFVVKDEIANTLNNIQKTTEDNVVTRASSTIMRMWKVWTLISPRRLFKYNARNLSGDGDAVFVGNPSTFKKVPQATKELFQVFRANRGMTPEMQEYFNRGGMLNTLQFQELKDINELYIFKNLFEKTNDFNLWKKYWNAARISTDFREQILRYASYLDYLEQMVKNNGRPRNFGASIPEEIMGLKDIRDRAFWLSNDLLGAYDRVSVLGQGVRRHLIPFYSWMEVNFTRYTRFAKNAARDERLAGTTGRKLVSLATRSPIIAYNVGKFAIKASAFWAMLQAYNQLRFPEEEKDLPPDIQAKPHIILGRTADGEVRYFDRLGALGDFLEWFGLDSPANDVRDYLNGKRTIKEIAIDMAKSPINKIVNAITPAYKVPAELATGKKLFPDVFKPSTVRDPADYIAQSLGLQNEFRALTGRPSKPYKESLAGLVEYRSDPEQAAYYYILDEKRRFLKKIGKGGEGSFSSPRSESLRNYKLALRYKDKEAAKKYLTEYVLLGGTDRGLNQSLSSMNPLYGLNKDEQTVFIESLNGEDRERLVKALKFFTETLAPTE
jgi:hypothetical protein